MNTSRPQAFASTPVCPSLPARPPMRQLACGRRATGSVPSTTGAASSSEVTAGRKAGLSSSILPGGQQAGERDGVSSQCHAPPDAPLQGPWRKADCWCAHQGSAEWQSSNTCVALYRAPRQDASQPAAHFCGACWAATACSSGAASGAQDSAPTSSMQYSCTPCCGRNSGSASRSKEGRSTAYLPTVGAPCRHVRRRGGLGAATFSCRCWKETVGPFPRSKCGCRTAAFQKAVQECGTGQAGMCGASQVATSLDRAHPRPSACPRQRPSPPIERHDIKAKALAPLPHLLCIESCRLEHRL